MRYLAWFAKIALFLLLFAFAIKNTAIVTVNGLLDLQWQAPLVLVLLTFFVIGVIAGLLTLWVPMSRLKRELQALQRKSHESISPSLNDSLNQRIEPAEPLDAVI